jgi:hypothetical protein
MPTDVLRGIFAAPVMGRTQTYHKHFTFALAAGQNVVNIAIGSGFVEQPAHNAAQVSNLGVPFLFSLGQG